MLFTIEELLTIAKEKKASDVHVTVGLPPRIRINGELVDLDYPKMTGRRNCLRTGANSISLSRPLI